MSALMLAGTGTDVGKSLLVAGLARALVNRGLSVRPFKPQNMSNNAAVTTDGGEIGRAQALQARACRVAAHTDFNPVLLKPQSEVGAQVVVHGKVLGNARAREYQALKPTLLPKVMESFARLRDAADVVLVEGAGSVAEVNLRAGDIANFGFACEAEVPVVLVGDIDRGGVIAQLVGTHALLDEAERALVRGYLVNRFRGDVRLFDGGLEVIGQRTGWRSHGVVPWFADARKLPAEDAMALESGREGASEVAPGKLVVAVPRLPRIANFDDLDPLIAEPDVVVRFVPMGEPLPAEAALVVLPGSKSTLADLRSLRETGWDIDIAAHVRRGGHVLGICAGLQMLGTTLSDPEQLEGGPARMEGLGLLDLDTEIAGEKLLAMRDAQEVQSGAPLTGYEMHVGRTSGAALERPWMTVGNRGHGAVNAAGTVYGCYLHGLFASDAFRHALLRRLAPAARLAAGVDRAVDETLDALGEHLEGCVDIDSMLGG